MNNIFAENLDSTIVIMKNGCIKNNAQVSGKSSPSQSSVHGDVAVLDFVAP